MALGPDLFLRMKSEVGTKVSSESRFAGDELWCTFRAPVVVRMVSR